MVKYFEIFHDFLQNQNGVRWFFVPLICVLGETLKSIFEAFRG